MFIRKLYKIGDKARWLALELLIVFIGVYLAFLFQNYNEQRKQDREKEKVYAALKYELEFFRTQLPGRSTYTMRRWRELKKDYDSKTYANFSDWRFIQPQYDYKIIEYAIDTKNSEIVDFKLYNQLQTLYTRIKRLENAENLIMEMAQRYKRLPTGVPDSHPEVRARIADNYENFGRFLRFMRDRGQNQGRVARDAANTLEIINELMDPEIRKTIETELIESEIGDQKDFDSAWDMVQELFPNFTKEEIENLYNKK